MRKCAGVAITSVLVSTAVCAEWLQIDDTKVMTIYVDPASIKVNGDRVTLSDLYRFKQAQTDASGKPYWSQTMTLEYDCQRRHGRKLGFALHAEEMGDGRLIDSDNDPSDWRRISPMDAKTAVMDFACRKK